MSGLCFEAQKYTISRKCAILTHNFFNSTPKTLIPQNFDSRDSTKNQANKSMTCSLAIWWSHLGLNQGLPDYESGALTN